MSPSRTRSVMAAAACRSAQPSKIGCCHGPWIARRWSQTQIESQLAASAASVASRNSGHVVRWGHSWSPNFTGCIGGLLLQVVVDRDDAQPERDPFLGPEAGHAVLVGFVVLL